MLDEEYLTYSQLNAKANQLASYLVSIGIKTDELVGICLERSIDLLVAILGIMKAGAGYLPLDPHYPLDRLKFMIDDSKLRALLSKSNIINDLSLSVERVFLFDLDIEKLGFHSTANPHISIELDNIAYVIYTSGSTGIPKGVVVSHKNLAYSTTVRCNYYKEKINKYLLLSSYSFDSSVAGIFWTLISGGALVLLREGEQKNIESIRSVIREKEVSHLLCLPSLYELLLTNGKKEHLESLKVAIVAGETCSRELVNKHVEILNKAKLYNEYGPTEATVWSTVYEITSEKLTEEFSIVPIGKPIDGTNIYILDDAQNPTPIAVAGELYIGGEGLTRGYLNRPELTAERFIPNRFSQEEGSRLYKTGDLAKWLPNGNIEFIGRVDNQVKLRGFRIELGEIENAIIQNQLVKECVVQIKGEKAENKQLVAYVVSTANGKKQIVEELRNYLKTKLPDHMVPTAFVLLKEFPITPNGKVDRKALLNIDIRQLTEYEQSNLYIAPRTSLEKVLAEIWKETLGVDNPLLSSKER
jgi:amino acid adenylation domain-containing protein